MGCSSILLTLPCDSLGCGCGTFGSGLFPLCIKTHQTFFSSVVTSRSVPGSNPVWHLYQQTFNHRHPALRVISKALVLWLDLIKKKDTPPCVCVCVRYRTRVSVCTRTVLVVACPSFRGTFLWCAISTDTSWLPDKERLNWLRPQDRGSGLIAQCHLSSRKACLKSTLDLHVCMCFDWR